MPPPAFKRETVKRPLIESSGDLEQLTSGVRDTSLRIDGSMLEGRRHIAKHPTMIRYCRALSLTSWRSIDSEFGRHLLSSISCCIKLSTTSQMTRRELSVKTPVEPF
jgi:hypothetical protein